MNENANPAPKKESIVKKNRRRLLAICLTGLFVALGVAVKSIAGFTIPIMGPGGMRVGLAGIFTAFPAFLFGPLYGGVASGLSDVLGYVIKPDGAYIPWLSLTAFLGGVLKGLLWKWLKNGIGKKGGAILLVLFLLVGAYSFGVYDTLHKDGVMTSFITNPRLVPTKGQVSALEINSFGRIAVDLASYNNDTITLRSVDPASEVTIPAKISLDGYINPVKKIGKDCFVFCTEPLTVYIPSTVTSIDPGAFAELKQVTVIGAPGSAAETYAASQGFAFTAEEREEEILPVSSSSFETEGLKFNSSETYRKYLSGYLNFMTIGLLSIAVVGAVTSVLFLVLSGKKTALLARTAASCVLSGVIVTTINTVILQYAVASYAGRAFLLLWIPRFIEEIIVCLVQSYVIFLLLGVYQTKVRRGDLLPDLG